MDIAIIGAGNVGKALATAFTRAGHNVTIASRDPEDAGAVAAATGSTIATSNADAARAADVVVLAIPFASAADVAAEIAEATTGKPVVDVSNRISFGPEGPEIDTTSSNGEAVGALFPTPTSSRRSTRSSPPTRPTPSPTASSSTASSPGMTPRPRPRSSSSSPPWGSTRSTSGRSAAPASSRRCPS